MFSRKRRMPPMARRRKAQLTIPSKFWKPELEQKISKAWYYFYDDLWIERKKISAWYWILTNLQDMRESLGLWIGLSGWLLRTWRCCNWKKRMQAILFVCPLRFRLFFVAELWFYVFGNLGIFCDNVLGSRCRIGSPEPALFFTLSLRMFWMAISESGNQSDIEADVLPRLWHSWLYKGKYWPATHIVFSHFSFLWDLLNNYYN